MLRDEETLSEVFKIVQPTSAFEYSILETLFHFL